MLKGLRLQGERGAEVVEFLHAAARPVLLPLVLPEVHVSGALPVARGPLGLALVNILDPVSLAGGGRSLALD